MNIKFRDVRPSDYKKILAIRDISDPYRDWEEKDFRDVIADKNNVSLIVEANSEVAGYLIYKINRKKWPRQASYDIVTMAVASHLRRKKIGFAMFERMVLNLKLVNGNRIGAVVSDTRLDIHLFLSSLGFEAVEIFRNFYGVGHNGYDFLYNIIKPYKKNKKNAKEVIE